MKCKHTSQLDLVINIMFLLICIIQIKTSAINKPLEIEIATEENIKANTKR